MSDLVAYFENEYSLDFKTTKTAVRYLDVSDFFRSTIIKTGDGSTEIGVALSGMLLKTINKVPGVTIKVIQYDVGKKLVFFMEQLKITVTHISDHRTSLQVDDISVSDGKYSEDCLNYIKSIDKEINAGNQRGTFTKSKYKNSAIFAAQILKLLKK